MLLSFLVILTLYLVGCILISCKYSIKEYWWCYLVAIGLFLPIGLYISRFWNHEFSEDPGMWGVFGDYIGGVYNVLTSVLIFYISYRMSKVRTRGEKAAMIAKNILSQIEKIKTNGYHHMSVQKLLKIIHEEKYNIDELLYRNIIDLADSYTCARADKTPVNKRLEDAVIRELTRMSNG